MAQTADMTTLRSSERSSPPWTWWAVAGLMLLFAVVAWYAREPGVVTGNDDARYILLSRALREGTYRDLYRVGDGWHSLYPPAYPALLALFGAIFRESYDLFVGLNIVLAAAGLLLVFDAVRRLWSAELGLAVLAASVLNLDFMARVPTWVMSEAQFLFLVALALWVLVARPRSTGWLWVAGGAACLSALTRSIGVTLLAGIGVTWLVERRWKALGALFAGGSLFVGPWLAWTFMAPAQYVGRSYAADMGVGVEEGGTGTIAMLLERIWDNATAYLTRVIPSGLALPTIPDTLIDNIFWLVVVCGLGLVGLSALWRRWKSLVLFFACYFGLLLVWPWYQSRFAAPLIPFLHVTLFAGAWRLGRMLDGRRAWIAPGALAAVVGLAGATAVYELARTRSLCDRSARPPSLECQPDYARSYVAGARYMGDSLPRSAGVVAGKDASVAYLSGLDVVPAAALIGYPPDRVSGRVRELGAEYALLGRVHAEDLRLAETLLPACRELVLVRSFEPDSHLLRLQGEEGPGGSQPACGALARLVELGLPEDDPRPAAEDGR